MAEFEISNKTKEYLVNGFIHLLEHEEDIVSEENEIKERYGVLRGAVSLGSDEYADINVAYRENVPTLITIFLYKDKPEYKLYDDSGGIKKKSNKKWEWIFKQVQDMSRHSEQASADNKGFRLLQGFILPEFVPRRTRKVPETRAVLAWDKDKLVSVVIFPDSQMIDKKLHEKYKTTIII